MQKTLDMRLDLRGRRADRSGLNLERTARRPMRDYFLSWILSHVSDSLGLLAALRMDFLSSGGCAFAFPPYLRRTSDWLYAQPGRLGHPRHWGYLQRGTLDHLLQTDRASACVGRRSFDPFAATGAKSVPDRTGQSDYRRYAGSALRRDRTGHQHQARSQPQGQSAHLSEQPVLGHSGFGRASPDGFGADRADSLLAGRRIRTTWQALGGAATDRFGEGPRQGCAFADRCLVHAQKPDSALARTKGAHHRAGASGYRLVSSAGTGAEASRTQAQVRPAYRCGDAGYAADGGDGTGSLRQDAVGAGALCHRRGAISEGTPSTGRVVRDAPVRQHLVASTPDSGDLDRFVGTSGSGNLCRALGNRTFVSQSEALATTGLIIPV